MSNSEGQATPQPGRLSQLEGLRGMAAVAVMLFHAELVFKTDGPFGRGYLFVDLFFLLSGFVLAVSTERKLNTGVGPAVFLKARYLRLLPLAAVGTLVAAVRALSLGLFEPAAFAMALALDLAMIPNLSGAGMLYRFNPPQWTLFYELVANFFHAVLLRHVPTRWLPLVAAVLGAGLVAAVLRRGGDTMGAASASLLYTLPRVGWAYVVGVWMGRLYRQGLRWPAPNWLVALAIPLTAIVVLPGLPFSRATGDLMAALVVLPACLWLVAMSQPPARLRPLLDRFGGFSLPLYCVHLIVLVWISEVLGLAAWVQAVAIASSLALAWMFSRLVSFAGKPLLPAAGASAVA